MKILIVHRGFPGQFKHLLAKLLERGDEVTCIIPSLKQGIQHSLIKNIAYKVTRGNGKGVHQLAIETESKVLRGEAVAIECISLQQSGYEPDLILGHPGWGEMLFIKDIWPETPQVHYVEYAYKLIDSDLDFSDSLRNDLSDVDRMKVRMKNANVLLNLDSMSWELPQRIISTALSLVTFITKLVLYTMGLTQI